MLACARKPGICLADPGGGAPGDPGRLVGARQPGRGREQERPAGGRDARPQPGARARRGQPGRREPPAGGTGHAQTAARSRRERASAPPARATYLGAPRPRMLQVRAGATPTGRGQGAGWPGVGGRCSSPPRPHPYPGRTADARAGGLARAATPGSQLHVEAGKGPLGRAHLARRGREGAGRAGWGSTGASVRDAAAAAAGRGRALGLGGRNPAEPVRPASGPGGPRAAAAPAPGSEGAHSPRGTSQAWRLRDRFLGRIHLSAFKDGISWAWHVSQCQ